MPQPAAPVVTQAPPIQYDDLMDALTEYEKTTRSQAEDLTTATFERNSEFGSLIFGTNNFELNEWSARQLCRFVGIPFGVFRKSSEKLCQDMFDEFKPGMKDPQIKLALKTFGLSKTVLRGILPVDYPDIRNSEVLGSLRNVAEPFVVESASWLDGTLPHVLRTRVVFPNLTRDVNGEELKIGLDITNSELGGCDLLANLLIYREVCKNGAIASYGRKPYFHFDYSSTFTLGLGDIFEAAVQRAGDDVDTMMSQVELATSTPCTIEQAEVILFDALKEGALNKGVVLKTLATLKEDGCATVWDLVNGLTSQARGHRDLLRVRYEAAAGALMGLSLDRGQKADEFAPAAKELPLLNAVN